MKRIIISGMAFLFSAFAHGQASNKDVNDYNSDYNRARRDVQKEYEAQAERNRQPNSPYSGYKGLSDAEKAKLQSWWNNLTGKATPEEEAARQAKLDAAGKKYEAYEKERRRKQSEELAYKSTVAEPFKKLLIQMGLDSQESENIATNYANQKVGSYGDYGNGTRNFIEEMNAVEIYLTYFYANYESADFESLKQCAAKLVDFNATITANKLTKLINAKFPDKKKEMDEVEIKKFTYFFQNPISYNSRTDYGIGNFRIMIEDYFAYENTNPIVNLIVFNATRYLDHDAYELMQEYNMKVLEESEKASEKNEAKRSIEKLNSQELKIKAINGLPNSKINPYKLLLEKKISPSNLKRFRQLDNKYGFTFFGTYSGWRLKFGVCTNEDGTLYYGGFTNGDYPDGKGIYVFKDGTYYEGEFEKDYRITYNLLKKGKGKITFPNGYYVLATFSKDVPENSTYFDGAGNAISKETFDAVCDLKAVTNKKISDKH